MIGQYICLFTLVSILNQLNIGKNVEKPAANPFQQYALLYRPPIKCFIYSTSIQQYFCQFQKLDKIPLGKTV